MKKSELRQTIREEITKILEAKDISDKLKELFVGTLMALEPENLHQDGEASASHVRKRKAQLVKYWKQLERKAGKKVSEDDVYGWVDKHYNWKSSPPRLGEAKAKFTVTIEKVAGKYSQNAKDETLERKSFDDEPDAKKYVKQMVKRYKLTRQRGFWGNAKTSIELTTNF